MVEQESGRFQVLDLPGAVLQEGIPAVDQHSKPVMVAVDQEKEKKAVVIKFYLN